MKFYFVTYLDHKGDEIVKTKTVGIESKKEIIDDLNEPILLSFLENGNDPKFAVTEVHEIDEVEFLAMEKHLFFL